MSPSKSGLRGLTRLLTWTVRGQNRGLSQNWRQEQVIMNFEDTLQSRTLRSAPSSRTNGPFFERITTVRRPYNMVICVSPIGGFQFKINEQYISVTFSDLDWKWCLVWLFISEVVNVDKWTSRDAGCGFCVWWIFEIAISWLCFSISCGLRRFT